MLGLSLRCQLFLFAILLFAPLAHGTDATADLLTSASHGDLASIDRALAADANLNALDGDLKTPLVLAIDWGHEAAALRLLEAGADVNVRVTKARVGALRYAVDRQSLPLVKALLAKGANVDDGHEPGLIMNALVGGSVPVLQELLAHGADWRVRYDRQGTYALENAIACGNDALMDFLLAQGANIDQRDDWGNPPLFIAAWNGRTTSLAKLLVARVNVNEVIDVPWKYIRERVEPRNTALMLAAGHGQFAAVQMLLQAKADPCLLDSAALRLADQQGFMRIARLLRQAGATYTAPAVLPRPAQAPPPVPSADKEVTARLHFPETNTSPSAVLPALASTKPTNLPLDHPGPPSSDVAGTAAQLERESLAAEQGKDVGAAMKAADAAWQLGARSPELALRRVVSRARWLDELVWKLSSDFSRAPSYGSDEDTDTEEFFLNPLHHWQNAPDVPDGNWFCDEAQTLLDAYEEGVAAGLLSPTAQDAQAGQFHALDRALSGATWPVILLPTVSDQEQCAQKLSSLRARLLRVSAEDIRRWDADPHGTVWSWSSRIQRAHLLPFWASTEEEFVAQVRNLLDSNPFTDTLKGCVDLRFVLASALDSKDIVNGENIRRWFPTAWQALSEALPPDPAGPPEDQLFRCFLRSRTDTSTPGEREAVDGFMAAMDAMKGPYQTDVRVVKPCFQLFKLLAKTPWVRERLAFFRENATSEARRTVFAAQTLEYLCDHDARLTSEALEELAGRAAPGTEAGGIVQNALTGLLARVSASTTVPDKAGYLQLLSFWTRRVSGPSQPTRTSPVPAAR